MEKQSPKLYVKVYNDLVSKIQSGFYKSGDKIPTEMELTQIYSVSRITVIHALKELENINLIRRIKKSGTFVGEKTIKNKPQLLVPVLLPFQENFHYNFLEGAQNFAIKNNIFLSFFNYNNSVKNERDILLNILNMNVNGVILYPCYTFHNLDLLSRLILKGVKIVFYDRRVEGIDAPCITTDNINAVKMSVNYLLKTGHKRIGFFGLNDHMISTERDRFLGYSQALIENNMPIDSKYLFHLDNLHEKELSLQPIKHKSVLDFYINRSIEQYLNLEQKPDAICFSTDICAISFMEAALKKNIKIPEDISIFGFDNIKDASSFEIPLSTVSQDFLNLGTTIVEIMMGLLSGKKYNPEIRIPASMIIRQSTRSRY